MGAVNFNEGTKYEKTNFNLDRFYFTQNDKALLNMKHQNTLIYKLIQKLVSYIAVKC